MLDQQERTEAGASRDDLDAPFSLLVLSKSAPARHPQVGGGTACGSCALSEGRPAMRSFPASMDRPADAAGGLCIGRNYTDALWAWGR